MGQDNVYFVTGTDTGVGKTFITSALLRAARARGLTCVGYKPVAAGAILRDGTLTNDDALELMAAAPTSHNATTPTNAPRAYRTAAGLVG